MIVVGLNSGLDGRMQPVAGGGVAIVRDGAIVGAVAEERVSRRKHDGGYRRSLPHLLRHHDIRPDDVDFYYISFYGSPVHPRPDLFWFHAEDLGLAERPDRLRVVPSHHLSHAYLSYFLSPFDEALVVVADNEGSALLPKGIERSGIVDAWCERNSYYWARGNSISLIDRDFAAPGEVAFGKAYNKFTRYIGFGDYHNAGKTMGLSAYGTVPPEFRKADLWSADPRGRLVSRLRETHDYRDDVRGFFGGHGLSVAPPGDRESYLRPEYQLLAAFVQAQLEKWSVMKCGDLMVRSGVGRICLGGGVALNSVVNARIERTLRSPVFVPPYPSDEGQALGNAIYGYLQQVRMLDSPCANRQSFSDFTYLGGEYGDAEITAALSGLSRDRWRWSRREQLGREVAELLASGAVVGWFQGRSEYGARALGNRSVLGDPRSVELRDRINRLKGRELFRPLAPAVLAERAADFFESADSLLLPHMLGAVWVRPEKIDSIRGAVHVDNTARAQVVRREHNPRFHDLIREFDGLSGVPMVINTSFNAAGDPIVESPDDAIEACEKMNLDGLAIGSYLVTRMGPPAG